MLADLPPPTPLVCIIEKVDSEWVHHPIAGIRELKHQQFVLHQGSVPSIEPRTVVESRITTLVDRFSSSGVNQDDPAEITYNWSFDAPLGLLGFEDAKNSEHTSSHSIVVVSGTLTIRNRLNFELNQRSKLTEANGTRTLNSLQETAIGRCREQGRTSAHPDPNADKCANT